MIKNRIGAIGYALRVARKFRGKSQTEIAKSIGVCPSCISGIEKGRNTNLQLICDIADYLGYDIHITLRQRRKEI